MKSDKDHGDPYRLGENVGYLLSRARLRLVKVVDLALAEHGITSAQAGIIMLLANGRCGTAAELARELYADSASMTRMLDRLEKRALLTRMPHTRDRRVMQLALTAEGRKLARRLPANYRAVIDAHFAGFSATELATLKRLLLKSLGDEAAALLQEQK